MEWIKVNIDKLFNFGVEVFKKLGVPEDDAKIVMDVLIASDRRGISSHGVARMRRYVNGIKSGIMKPVAKIEILKETPNTILASGGDGLGQVVGYRVMEMVIKKALDNNVCVGVVRNSNHYGIAGYYAMMALKYDLIGVSLTNSAPIMVPTYGKDAVLGTNPLALAFPAGKEKPIVLDMATSTVPRGKLEVYNRLSIPLPTTWATDETGRPTQDAARVLANLIERRGGGLLPLGGADEETGGHKGYGLSFVIDILTGVLSGGAFGPNTYKKKGEPPNICHMFAALRIDAFMPVEEFKARLDEYINILRNSSKADGATRIYVAGEKEAEKEEIHKDFVEIDPKVYEDLKSISEELSVPMEF